MHTPLYSSGVPSSDASLSRLRRLLQRAETYAGLGDRAQAISSLEDALKLQPDHVPALLQLADLQIAEGRHNPAYEAALKATTGHMDSPRTALHLLRVLGQLSRSTLMIEIARQLSPPMWDSAKSLAEVSQELSFIGAHELARDFAYAALARDPRHPPTRYMCATMDIFFGEMKSAAEHAQRCLDLLPDDPSAHWLLSRTRTPGAEQRVEAISSALTRAPKGESEAWLAYALHNELHDLRDYGRAWEALERGCRAKRSTLRYSTEESTSLFDALCEWRVESDVADEGCVDPALTPIFVIGLHRSGTTLAERILSGHSAVAAGGETYDIRAQLRRASGLHFTSELDPQVLRASRTLNYRAIGQGYLQSIAWRARGAPMVTDKLPSNYFNVGFIARALPAARFICLDRDPIDVGLSSLRTLFSSACPYSYDQTEYVAHYRNFKRLMAHWRSQFPDRILEVAYDDLVNAPEATATLMARFCGLDYEPAMLQIESRSDAVATASSVMMRDGIRRDRGRVWSAYEQQLQPMIQALGTAT
jgi:tetratricopeptide (TPR) repeat protein